MNGRPVLLLPGIWLPQATLIVLARRLRREGFPIRLFRYGTMRESTERVLERLASRCRESPPAAAIVGHSLGGLLALAALARHSLAVPRVVCLGSPLRGSAVARALASSPITRGSLGQHRRLLCEGLSETPPGAAIGVIAGTLPVGIGVFVPSLEHPHDGVVALAETRLPGLADHLALRLNHSGLLLSPAVARAVAAFVRTGAFAPTSGRDTVPPGAAPS